MVREWRRVHVMGDPNPNPVWSSNRNRRILVTSNIFTNTSGLCGVSAKVKIASLEWVI